TAWMTSEFFEEWITKIDSQMRSQNRHILLWSDNFSDPDIFKINLLEVLTMAKIAWEAVTKETIVNCWRKAGILGCESFSTKSNQIQGWNILRTFASTPMTLPEAEKQLKELFGDSYHDEIWRAMLSKITCLEPDSDSAAIFTEIDTHLQSLHSSTASVPTQTDSIIPVERDLMEIIADLKTRNRIFGETPTLEELVDPVEEKEISESAFHYGEDAEKKIVDQVNYEQAVKRGEIVEIEEDDDEDDGPPDVSLSELLGNLKLAKEQCLTSQIDSPGVAEEALKLTEQLRKFRGQVQKLQLLKAKQVPITNYFDTK
ncbi:hypothetical protein GGU11DRAFT_690352, partial [Lentinula aff. detonsa]